MTVLTSIINIALQVSGQLSALIISWMGIECEEDPEDENEVLCVFDYLWLLIVWLLSLSSIDDDDDDT